MRIIKRILQAIKEGWQEAWSETRDPIHNYQQEQERLRILKHVCDGLWTDEFVYREFLDYIFQYDKKMRLTRTRELLDNLIEQRPCLRDAQVRRQILEK